MNSHYTIVLFGTPGTKEFIEFHNFIVNAVKHNPLKYILRVIPQNIISNERYLEGYGVFLDIKNISFLKLF